MFGSKCVIRASYGNGNGNGNDSVALIQWCVENGVKDATVLYNDTGWARKGWPRQGVQFCTERWPDANDPARETVSVIGVRRCAASEARHENTVRR